MAALSHTIQLVLVIAGCCASGVFGSNILAIFPDPSKSHIIAYEPLTKELAARGHYVTVISSHPQKVQIENYTDIAVPLKWFGTDSYHKALLNKDSEDGGLAAMNYAALNRCRHFLENPGVQQLIRDRRQRFDVIIMELYLHQCFIGFAHIFNTSVIGIYGHTGSVTAHDLVGDPSPPSYVPNIFQFYTDRLSFRERIINFRSALDARKFEHSDNSFYEPLTWEYFKEFEPIPTIEELQRRFAFLFFNNDVSLNFPRPHMPNVADIAGMHIRPTGKLPKDLQVLLDKAKNGVVIFCMGSILGNFLSSKEKIKVFGDAFSQLKQLVIWKREEPILGLAKNIKVMSWLPLNDIFAHPNVRLFVTHGGLLSLQEAVYNAIPIVGIPICADQFFNIQRAVDFEFAIKLDYETMTSDDLQRAMNTVINNASYGMKAFNASSRFRDQIIPPLQKAVFWTEYVIRHNGAKHLQSAGLDLNIYQYLLLDVLAVLLLGAALFVFILYKTYQLVRAMCGRIRRAYATLKTKTL